MDPSTLRTDYRRASLDAADVDADPFRQFAAWYADAAAAGVPEVNAMTLATVGADGRPSARIVLLRGVDARGLTFYTNYGSRKGRDLDARPDAALLFFWPQLERQVRIEGTVARALRWFGPDRCMFGSDWPVCLLASEYGDAIAIVGDDEDVLAGTATRTYGLRVPA